MMRLRILGCNQASLKCLVDVLRRRDQVMIEDYFTEVANALFLPFHPGEELVDIVIEEKGDGKTGAVKIEAITSDGENRHRYTSYCYEIPGTGLVCIPAPEEIED